MTTTRSLIVLSILAASATVSVTVASAQSKDLPPGPEHKALEFFIGKWRTEGQVTASALGPGGKVTGTVTCEAFAGGYHVLCRIDWVDPVGPIQALGIWGYNRPGKYYNYFAIDSRGLSGSARATLADDAWVYTGESRSGLTATTAGRLVRSRYTIKKINADTYTFKWEVSVDDGPFTVILEGTDARVKPASH